MENIGFKTIQLIEDELRQRLIRLGEDGIVREKGEIAAQLDLLAMFDLASDVEALSFASIDQNVIQRLYALFGEETYNDYTIEPVLDGALVPRTRLRFDRELHFVVKERERRFPVHITRKDITLRTNVDALPATGSGGVLEDAVSCEILSCRYRPGLPMTSAAISRKNASFRMAKSPCTSRSSSANVSSATRPCPYR